MLFPIVGFVQKDLVKDILKECGRMYRFDHPNVLKLLGVCMDGGPAPFIVMPFMANGSLNTYLKKERENLLLDPESTTPEDVVRVNMHFGPTVLSFDHFLEVSWENSTLGA